MPTHRATRATRRASVRGALLAATLLACGCHDDAPAQPATQPASQGDLAAPLPRDPAEAAAVLYATRCTLCHGVMGTGGPLSSNLMPRPRNLTSPDWQKSTTDAQIEKVIAYGGGAIGKSETMPGNPDLVNRPELLAALRTYVRAFARPKPVSR